MGKRGIKPADRAAFEQRFWARLDKTGDCWIWPGATNSRGYGQIRWGGKIHITHRLALEITLGRKLKAGENSLHKCDRPPCCRPEHLFPGTQAMNIADCQGKGRNASKLSRQDVDEIRREYRPRRVSLRMLGERFAVSPQQIRNIVRGIQWAKQQA